MTTTIDKPTPSSARGRSGRARSFDWDAIYRAYLSGYATTDIIVEFGASPATVAVIIKKMRESAGKPKASISITDDGFKVSAIDRGAAVNNCRAALERAGWDVKG